MNYAINKKKLVKIVYQGTAIPAKSPLPPQMWGHKKDLVDYEYNPVKAKQLLKEAGYENGFKTTLWYSPRSWYPKGIERLIKANLKAVGIEAKVVVNSWKEHLKKIDNGEHDMVILGWGGDNGDPDNFLYVLLDQDNAVKPHALNNAFFRHPKLHELLIQAQQTFQRSERVKLYHRAQDIILEQAPWVPLAHAKVFHIFHKTVNGVSYNYLGSINFHHVWID